MRIADVSWTPSSREAGLYSDMVLGARLTLPSRIKQSLGFTTPVSVIVSVGWEEGTGGFAPTPGAHERNVKITNVDPVKFQEAAKGLSAHLSKIGEQSVRVAETRFEAFRNKLALTSSSQVHDILSPKG